MTQSTPLYATQVRDLIQTHGFKKFIETPEYVANLRDGLLIALCQEYTKTFNLTLEQGRKRRQEILQRLELYLHVPINNEEDYAAFKSDKSPLVTLRHIYDKLHHNPCVAQLQYITDTVLSFEYHRTDGRMRKLIVQEDSIGFQIKNRCMQGPIDTLTNGFIGPKMLRNLLSFVNENQHRFALGLETTSTSWYLNVGRYVFAPVYNEDRVLLAISWIASISDYIESEFNTRT